MPNIDAKNITLGLLAGGEARRFNGRDKGLVQFHSQRFVEVTMKALLQQAGGEYAQVLISANRNIKDYQCYAHTVKDLRQGYNGPLAGVEALLNTVETDYLLCAPCDLIRPPKQYVMALAQALGQTGIKAAYLHDGSRAHYTCLMLHRSLLLSLQSYLDDGKRSMRGWLTEVRAVAAVINEKVLNINSPQDLASFTDER